MVKPITGIDPARVQENLARVRAEIGASGRDQESVEILAAVKYVPLEELVALAEGGIRLVGENRAQELEAKAEAHPGVFTWDFIGHLQSRKVRGLLPRVRYLQTVASDSVLAQLQRHATTGTEVLVEVNVARETSKSGVLPQDLKSFLERCPVPVSGLMTMPPLVAEPEANRAHFRALRQLAERFGLRELSMGTSQDYLIAVEEGATIIRLGRSLYR